MTDNGQHDAEVQAESLFYEEPARSSVAEGFGVLLALLALAVIGFAGYIWLTPGVEYADYLQRGGKADMATMPAAEEGASNASMPGMDSMEEEVRCPVCNMFALRSKSAIMARWSDGSETHHDSWDCVANWAADSDLQLTAASVVAYTADDSEAQWLDAENAAYRFGTDTGIAGSMPPNVAAFADRQSAEAAAEMGGEALDFSALLARLGVEYGNATSGMTASQGATEDSMENMPMDSGAGHDHSADNSMSPASDDGASGMEMPGQTDKSSLYAQAGFTDNSCPVCGMFADRSMTHVVVLWTDGSYTQHDSFDCAFGMSAEGGRQMDRIEVSLYDTDNPGSRWADAQNTSFLYDTSRIKGSMPPFVAAFGSNDEASAAQSELGGELLDFNGLAAKWQQ